MILYKLTDLYGKDHVSDGIAHRDGLLFATTPDNGDVPLYSLKYNEEFRRYHKDCIDNNEDIRDSGPGDNQGEPC